MANVNGNGFNKLIVSVAGGLAIVAIIASVKGYSEDGVRDQRVSTIEANVKEQGLEQREQHDAILNIERDIESIQRQNVRIMTAIERIADK